MKKFILFSSLLILSSQFNYLQANTLTAKDAEVTVLVDGQHKKIAKDKSIDVEAGSWITFIAGEGRALIDETIQLTSADTEAKQVPIKQGFKFKKLFKNIKIFFLTEEKVKQAVSTKGSRNQEKLKIIEIPKDKESLVIHRPKFGPHPVQLMICDKNGKTIQYYKTTKKTTTTLFIIPTKYLKEGYKIKIQNAWKKTLLQGQIKF